MRTAARPNKGRNAVSRTIQISAPVKGWTTENPVAAEEGTALLLDNWFPEVDTVRARRGSTVLARGMTGDVETLLPYTSATQSKLFAANGTNIFDVTGGGLVGSASLSGLSNGRWQHTMFATSGGQFLAIANGSDAVRNYDGSVWSTPVITGADSSTFISVMSHKHRLWFVKAGSTTMYYLPIDQIAGVATGFDFGALFRRGGYVMAGGTWSVDAGNGMDDLFVVISSEGECAVYQGGGPDFSIIGVYTLGKPIGRRCFYPVGGDLAVITEDGIVPLSKALKLDRAAMQGAALTQKIQKAYIGSVQRAGSAFGWQLISYPQHNMGLLNVPAAGSEPTYQYVVNTLTGAWARFTGWNALSWAMFDGKLYFGNTTGRVFRADYGGLDGAKVIQCKVLSAFLSLGSKGRLKHIKEIRPTWYTDVAGIVPQNSVAVDYVTPTSSDTASDVSSTGWFTWDVSAWDGPDIWFGLGVFRSWRGTSNIGTVVSPYMSINIDASAASAEFTFNLMAWDLVYELGGVI